MIHASIKNQDKIRAEQDRPSLAWPSIVIWLTVFATFLLPGRSAQITVSSLDAAALVKVASRLLTIVVLGWVIFSRLRIEKTRQVVASHLPWIVFAGWAILSTAWSPLRGVTLGQAAGQVALIFLSITVAMAVRTGEQKFLFHLIAALGVYAFIYGVGSLVAPNLFQVVRSGKSIIHPTALGASASLGAVIVVSLLLTSNWGWIKPLAIMSLPIFAAALLAANNRLSIALATLVCFGLIIARGQSFRLAAGAMTLAIGGVMYLVVDPGLQLVESAIGSSTDFLHRGQSVQQLTEFSGRAEMWSKMWQSFLESPIIGHGYFVCSSTGALYVWFTEQNHTAHNMALQALVSTGIIGLSIFVVWNLQVIKTYVLATANQGISPHLLFLAPATCLWFLGWSQLNACVLGPVRPESAVYAVVAGLVIGQYHQSRSRAQLRSHSDRPAAPRLTPEGTPE